MSSSRNSKSSAPASSNPEIWTWLIGEITGPLGLKGEMRVFPHTDFPERFKALRQVGVQTSHGTRIMNVIAVRIAGRRIVMRLDGVETIDQAEALRGARLVIPEAWALELDEDEYYHHQLLGLEVVTTAGESLGSITQIWPTGANDVYETPLALIPATKDMIRSIDLAQKRMIVDARPGLKKDEPGD